MAGVIWVYLERDADGINESSFQALNMVTALAEKTNGRLEGVCLGGEPEALKSIPRSIEKIYHVVGEHFDDYKADAFGNALETLVTEHNPSVLIFPSSTQGEDLASWVGAGLGVGVLLGAREIRRDGDSLVATRVEFDGKIAVDYQLKGEPTILSVEEAESGEISKAQGEVKIETVVGLCPTDVSRTRVIRSEVAKRTVNLRDARVIVAVGAGLGSSEAFEDAQELANVLGGEVGATRAAVDAGWVSYDRQIGQTGVKVRPDLYVALGISGAAQHRVGMLESGTILAVNIDPYAPIFRFSHYCVEGDVKAVLPKLIQILRR